MKNFKFSQKNSSLPNWQNFKKKDITILSAFLKAVNKPHSRIPMTLEKFAYLAHPDTLRQLESYWLNKNNPLKSRAVAYLVSQRAAAIKKNCFYPLVQNNYPIYHSTSLTAFLQKIKPEKTLRTLFFGHNGQPNISCNWGVALYCSLLPPSQLTEEALKLRSGSPKTKIVTLKLAFNRDIEKGGVESRMRFGATERILVNRVLSLLKQSLQGEKILKFVKEIVIKRYLDGNHQIPKWKENFAHTNNKLKNSYFFNWKRGKENYINLIALWDVIGMTFGWNNFDIYNKELFSVLFKVKTPCYTLSAGHKMISVPAGYLTGELEFDPYETLELLLKSSLFRQKAKTKKYIKQFSARRELIGNFFFHCNFRNPLVYFFYPASFRLGVLFDLAYMTKGEIFAKSIRQLIYDAYYYILVTEAAKIVKDSNSPLVGDSWEPNPYENVRLIISPTEDIELSLLKDNRWQNLGKYKFYFGPLPNSNGDLISLEKFGEEAKRKYRRAVEIIQEKRQKINDTCYL